MAVLILRCSTFKFNQCNVIKCRRKTVYIIVGAIHTFIAQQWTNSQVCNFHDLGVQQTNQNIVLLSNICLRAYVIILLPSFSHKSVHHFIVTMFPNHWWASSCATTLPMLSLFVIEELSSSKSNRVSLYVIRPQFSMAPAEKSGMAAMSILGRG